MNQYPELYLLMPKHLPRTRGEIDRARTGGIDSALAVCNRISPFMADEEALACVQEALRIMSTETVFVAEALGPNEHRDEHDAYCHIFRMSGDPVRGLLQGLLQGYSSLLRDALESGSSLNAQEWYRLRTAFSAMFRYMSRDVAPLGGDTLKGDFTVIPRKLNEKLDPMRRWLLGHHVFMVVIQGMVVAFNCFGDAMKAGDHREAEAALELATVLMWGSASALRFTGDFKPAEYESVVRPSMMPPSAPSELSGLMSIDHQCLVSTLTDLKPVFKGLEGELKNRQHLLTQAFTAAYEAHKYVCSRFVGDERPSLKMGEQAKKSGLTVLGHFQNSRVRLVSPVGS